jgi:hypothetical protein
MLRVHLRHPPSARAHRVAAGTMTRLASSLWLPRSATPFSSANVPVPAASASTTCELRSSQFRKTSEMLTAVNKGTTQKWITKTTGEYAAVSNKAQANTGIADADEQVREIKRQAEENVARLKDFRKARIGRYRYFFTQYGKGFTITYAFFYLLCLAGIYYGCRLRYFDKTTAFEFIFSLNFGSVDREAFFERVLAWDAYIDFGFAFLLNELLDMWRVPFCIGVFWQLRRLLSKHQRYDSIFRWQAPEAGTYDPNIQQRGAAAGAAAAPQGGLKGVFAAAKAAAQGKTSPSATASAAAAGAANPATSTPPPSK